ncbi:Lar family restriction alleviation protein [Marilutibacter spongiae]|uniref:Lar family restriction alleviation protein n=1 Tax=Marilutibacter spongiae TaxID=2025720 RepID=A0A7W3Y5E2_9GAMM|nr:Lar family restriction alleviation protein [Lysobacter spongiae]MBB1060373.1 Lar family restriction alleviation protein [Lysobacter spongiae]
MPDSAINDLAACPFCDTTEPEIYPLNRERTLWVADCGNPGCVTRVEDRYSSEAEAIAAWNRRSPRITRALALLAAVESGEIAGTWRPIETAPKDGVTPILVHESGIGESYIALRPIDCPDDAAATMFGHSACYPTHWMPLPSPPGTEMCWCETCRPNTPTNMRFIMCPNCGNKRCPKATNHVNACTGSNEPGQPGSSWENFKPVAEVKCPHRTRCDCLGACKYGFAGGGAAPSPPGTGEG